MKNENFEHCKSIAENLEKYVNGDFCTCPHCGDDLEWDTDDDVCICPHCGETLNRYDVEQLSLYDYFDDVYNIEWRLDANREYKSVALMVACGGPNIWIDTGSRRVELYWWSDSAYYPLSYDVVEAIDEYASEIFNC